MVFKGFTLIELLIVIAILSILSTIGVANFRTTRIKALDSQRKSDLQTIAKSLEAYANDHHNYPVSSTNNKITCQTDTICDWDQPFTDITGTIYAAKLPTDPSSYTYVYVSDGSSYSLYAHLDNLQDPLVTTFDPVILCGASLNCNYLLKSSNLL